MAEDLGGAGGRIGVGGVAPPWHDGCSPQPMEPSPGSSESLRAGHGGIDRRALLAAFLGGGVLTLAGLVRRPVIPLWRPADGPPAPARLFTDDERRTLVAVQDTFWPPGPTSRAWPRWGAPSTSRPCWALADVDPREGPAAKAGFARLDAVSAAGGVPRFHQLSPADRDTVLRTVAQEEAGAPFVAMVLAYTLEAVSATRSTAATSARPAGRGQATSPATPGPRCRDRRARE